MANTFFQPGEQRAAKVRALFARIASRYDLLNDLQSFGLHRYWKRRLVGLAAAQPGIRALDVCCGTGDLAFALARRGAETIGLDFSREMLAVAEAKAKVQNQSTVHSPQSEAGSPKSKVQSPKSNGLSPQSTVHRPQADVQRPKAKGQSRGAETGPLAFVQGDAQKLPFPEGSFDIVTVGYGLRNLADWEMGLREMTRVGRAGARLLVLDFGKPDNPLWRGLYFAYLRMFVPLLGLVFCGSAAAYAYILESLSHYPAQHGVAAQMRELGLVNVRIINLLGGVMTINYGEKPAVSSQAVRSL